MECPYERGEKTRFKLALALSMRTPHPIRRRPTSNLDMDGIELVEEQLQGIGDADTHLP